MSRYLLQTVRYTGSTLHRTSLAIGPTTRQMGNPTLIVSIRSNSPVLRHTVAQAKTVLSDVAGDRHESKLAEFECTIGLESTVDNINTACTSMAKLWSDTLDESQQSQSEDKVIAPLVECGGFIQDSIGPYSDSIPVRLHINIEAFHDDGFERWVAGGPNTFDLFDQTCRQVDDRSTRDGSSSNIQMRFYTYTFCSSNSTSTLRNTLHCSIST